MSPQKILPHRDTAPDTQWSYLHYHTQSPTAHTHKESNLIQKIPLFCLLKKQKKINNKEKSKKERKKQRKIRRKKKLTARW